MATRTLNLDESHEVPLVRGALAEQLKIVIAEQMILAVTRKRRLQPFELRMLPVGLRGLSHEELQEQINPWMTLCDFYRRLVELLEEPITPTMEEVLVGPGGGNVLTGLRLLSDYTRMWPQACAELSGFVRHLERTKATITADQIRMACELAEMRYRQMLAEAHGDTAESLLQAARTFIEHFVPVEQAGIDGFDVDAWCAAVDKILNSEADFSPGTINEDTETPTGTAVIGLRAEARNLVELGIDPDTIKFRFRQLVDEVAKEHADRQEKKKAEAG